MGELTLDDLEALLSRVSRRVEEFQKANGRSNTRKARRSLNQAAFRFEKALDVLAEVHMHLLDAESLLPPAK